MAVAVGMDGLASSVSSVDCGFGAGIHQGRGPGAAVRIAIEKGQASSDQAG